jgi:hypothetical protein
MRLSLTNALGIAVVVTICGCSGGLGGGEPSEAEMKDALLYLMNHPPGVTNVEPITIKFFKKEACDKPTGQGYHCTFDLQVQSANQLAGMYSDIPGANFYKDDKGKWQMRPPF